MLVNKINKGYEMCSDKPNSNWLDDNWYCIDDNSVLANKIVSLYPRFDFVLDDNKLVDVIEIEKTEEEIKKERIEDIKIKLEELDKTVDRQWEDYYERENITPVERILVVIEQKEELREELKTLGGASSGTEDTINK